MVGGPGAPAPEWMPDVDDKTCCPCPVPDADTDTDTGWEPPLPLLKVIDWFEDRLGIEVTLHPLLIAYGVVVALFLAFFIWEDAPFHRSQRIEKRYLKATVIMLFCTTLVAIMGPRRDLSVGMHQSINGVIMTVSLVHIWQRNRRKLVLPRFHSQEVEYPGTRKAPKEPPKPVAVRAERELDSLTIRLITNDKCIISDMGVFSAIVFLVIIAAIATLEPVLMCYVGIGARILFLIVICGQAVSTMLARQRETPARNAIHSHIKDIVSRQDRSSMEHVLETLSVGSLIEVAAPETVELLCEGSLQAGLHHTHAKAILIDALMKSGLSHNRLHMDALRHIMLSTTGLELTRLKDLIDGGGDYYNLFKLIYRDITDSGLRDSLLKHIAAQGQNTREQLGCRVGIKLLSDVDDTLYSSGGMFPAGNDTEYPKHMVYPGCLALFEALDEAFRAGLSSCNTVFLSARPHIYKDMAEDHSYRLFRALVEEGDMHSLPTLLPGHKTEGLEAMLTQCCRKTNAWKKVGELKFSTYEKFAELYREYDFIFFGDNGQGDLLAGQLMMNQEPHRRLNPTDVCAPSDSEESEHSLFNSSRLLAVLIHEVWPQEKSLALEPPFSRTKAWTSWLEAQSIFHHRTYVGAALALHQMDRELLPAARLAEVARRAVREFDTVRIMYPDLSSRWIAPERKLRADLEQVSQILAQARLEPLAPLVPTSELLKHSLPSYVLSRADRSATSSDSDQSSED